MEFLNGFIFVFTHPLNKGRFLQTFFRVCWWKFNQFFFSLPAIVPLTNNMQCICYPHLSYSGLIFYTKWPDFAEWNFLQQYLQKNHTFVDIGAHTGDYSLLAADKITSGRIFAFEPEPSVLWCLRQNIALNFLEKIISIIPKAVGDKKGTISFTLSTHSETSHLTTNSEVHSQKKVSVPVTTLDAFARENSLSVINVVKIDVEGAEGMVFAGAEQLLRQQKIDVILFELNLSNSEYGFSSEEILISLVENKYKIFSFSTPGSLEPVSANTKFSLTKNLLALSEKAMKNNIVKKYLNFSESD